MNDKKVLSSAEAARRLSVSLRTIQLWVEQGILPAWKTPGGHRRIPAEAVEELIAQQNAQVAGQTEASTKPFKILLVEDEEYLRKLYTKFIERLGYTVELELAHDGFQGLIKLGQQKPDLLITDLMMPAMDGNEMLRTIRSGNFLADEHIAVVTAMDPSTPEVKALHESGVQTLHKPLLLEDLRALLEQHIKPAEHSGPATSPL